MGLQDWRRKRKVAREARTMKKARAIEAAAVAAQAADAARVTRERTELLTTALAEVTPATRDMVNASARAAGGAYAITSLGDLGYPLVIPPDGYLTPINSGLGVAFSDSDADIDRLLQASAWSWAAITGNAKAISMLTPEVQEQQGGGWVKAPQSHPLWGWIDDPLGKDATLPFWPYSQLSYVSVLHYYIAGNAWWVPTVVGGELRSVTPILNPLSITATEDMIYRAPTEYKLTTAGRMLRLAPDEVVNIMAPSAGSFWRGSSALRTALASVDTDSVASARQNANLNNHIGAGLIFSTHGPLVPNDTQRTALKAEIIDEYRDAANQGDPLIVGGGITVTPNPMSSPELQVFETKRFTRTEILAIIGMPPSVAGILDKMILNNFGVSVVTWWHTHLLPVVQQMLGSINAQLVRPLYGSGTRLHYSLAGTDVSLQLLGAKLDQAIKLSQIGYATNDINEHLALGLPVHDYLNIPNQGALIAGRLDEMLRLVQELNDGILTPSEPVSEPKPAGEPEEPPISDS